ncbi:unnamed protein product [Somion occarium]|uniref:Phosphatidic acid phosphatase type 2/haloperoxidase domain-containing protein n=1 Tax=Somion occarium TaxID=3059160 RepID=A0ABP1DL15_9APHY
MDDTTPKSPTPSRPFDLRSTDWFSNGHSKESSATDDRSSFYTYESRATTPGSVDVDYLSEKRDRDEMEGEDMNLVLGGVGRLSDEVYDRALSWWRAAVRRKLVKSVEWESRLIATMQEYVRTPFLDAYFVYTSSLGTHTFFMTVLPAFYFFGYQEVGHGLLIVLAFGVYLSSFIKDLICSPRPFAPPVTRLTIGTHHLEYGFPSTHSTNSMSIALYLFTQIYRLYSTPSFSSVDGVLEPEMMISKTTFYAASSVLVFYTFSIVYGRVYTAMHSLTDCAVGVLLGTFIWALHLWCGDVIGDWLRQPSYIVPAITIPLCLLLVHRHPQPVDDCPCFEDAIAFMSVVLGQFLTIWFMAKNHLDERFFLRVMPGKPVGGTWSEMSLWWSIAAAKMVVGVLTIFAWRIFAKFLLHRILPPIFRFLSHLFTLPHRRFYTPATDYTNVAPEKGLHPIPSVIDLPGMVELEADGVNSASTGHRRSQDNGAARDIKLRGGKGGKNEKNFQKRADGLGLGLEEMGGKQMEVVKHYDADVLTKVFVYCGIGIIAIGVMPVIFELLGWGLRAV